MKLPTKCVKKRNKDEDFSIGLGWGLVVIATLVYQKQLRLHHFNFTQQLVNILVTLKTSKTQSDSSAKLTVVPSVCGS